MIVSMTAYDRPDYLRKTMASLRAAALHVDEPVFVIARIEPSNVWEECAHIIGSGRGTYVTVNPERLGLQRNTFEALSDAWRIADTMDEDFVLHMEDDFVLSPDALRMHAWMRDEYRLASDIFFTGSYGCRTADEVKPGWETKVYRGLDFSCRAWGHWRDVWEYELRAEWPHGEGHIKEGIPSEWGWFVNERVMDGRKVQMLPELSRVMHIGIKGEHSNAKWFAKDWEGLPLADTIYDTAYYE